ncbi:hypothetical protein FB468_1026 [Leucobacter komagatae]|uniref:Uncharacterized protein n=1 Tax=Leucobacter komagatae TaxID=55969 RepID=A0A542Y4L7_9MICO|nr:hypothetical protein FB468_1026 [Leucobacter komagatae]
MGARGARGAYSARRSWRALFGALAGTLLVIVGLLGMHTLAGGPDQGAEQAGVVVSGHGSPVVSGQGAPVASEHGVALAEGAHAPAAQNMAPADQHAPDHDAMAFACALALIVGMLLLVIPSVGHWLRTTPLSLTALAVQARRLLPPPTPSLITLSISRT